MSIKSISKAALSSLFVLSGSALAQPEIHFTDYRVFLDVRNNKSDYEIFNQGSANAVCQTGLVDYQVGENGKLILVTEDIESPETSALDIIKISPRNVRVNSMSSQKLKIFGKRIRNLPDGEWVSYLELSCKNADFELKPGININPTFKYHIPVVVRKGNLTATVNIKDSDIIEENNKYFMSVSIERQGNRSTYGAVIIKDETGDLIGKQTGISQYLQTSSLQLKVPLTRKPQGKVSITYEENKKYGGSIKEQVELAAL
jgi:hypothetical protein